MLETTFFSTVQIKGIIKFVDKSLSHDLHNAIGHLGVSPTAWSSWHMLVVVSGKRSFFLASARFLFTLTFVLAYDLASHSGIYPEFLSLTQRINPL